MKCKLWTETLEFSRLKVPNSRFALHGLAPPYFTVCAPFLPLIHGLCAFFRLLDDTSLDSPFSATLSVHGLHFTVCAPSNFHQSVIFRWGISRALGTSLGTSPCTRAKVTLVHRSHTQQNQGKQVSFSWKPLGTPLEAMEFLFFCAKGVPQEHRTKWHPESDTWTCWKVFKREWKLRTKSMKHSRVQARKVYLESP